MRRIVFFLVLCLSLFSCHRQEVEPELHEIPSVGREYDSLNSREAFLEEIYQEMQVSDSITVSSSEWWEMRDACHPDSFIEEVDGMIERATPMGQFIKFWGVCCLVMLGIAVLLFLLRLVFSAMSRLLELFVGRRRKGDHECMEEPYKEADESPMKPAVGIPSDQPEEDFSESDLSEKKTVRVKTEAITRRWMWEVGIYLPFVEKENEILDCFGKPVAQFYGFEINQRTMARLVNLLNEVPGEIKFPAGTFDDKKGHSVNLYLSNGGFISFNNYVDYNMGGEYLVKMKEYFCSHVQEEVEKPLVAPEKLEDDQMFPESKCK